MIATLAVGVSLFLGGATTTSRAQVLLPHNNIQVPGTWSEIPSIPGPNTPGQRYLTPPVGPRFPSPPAGYRGDFPLFGPSQPRLLPDRSYFNPLGPEYFEPYPTQRVRPWHRYYSDRNENWEIIDRWSRWHPDWPYSEWQFGRIERNSDVHRRLQERLERARPAP